ncbi:MAG: tripartite tricarboxylate transporter permease [Marinobacter sp.]|nr:tripartite tricarboxylate transporter permease [Marinobacter sp.]
MELLGYFLDALTPFNLMLALIGVILGTVIGALPGLSATMAVAVLVPFTFTMDPRLRFDRAWRDLYRGNLRRGLRGYSC